MTLHRTERAERTRHRILETAALAFAENGYGQTALSDIVVASGLTKGALYHHFSSKEALGLAVFRHKQEQLVDYLLAAAAAEGDALNALRTAFRARAELLVADTSTQAVLRLGSEFRVDATPGSEFTRFQELAIEYFSDLVRRGQREGGIRTSLDPRVTGELIFAAMVGMDDVSRFLSNLDDLPERSNDLLDLLVEGLAARRQSPRRLK